MCRGPSEVEVKSNAWNSTECLTVDSNGKVPMRIGDKISEKSVGKAMN
jgi:hypothetical protein